MAGEDGSGGGYFYPIEQCNVLDRPLLEQYRAKRTEWLGWLENDPDHNLWSQIHAIMWNDAAYRALNESRRFSADKPTAAANGMVGEFLDRGYIATQVLDICKITDKRDDVVSLRRLLGEIRKHRELITRENFVAYDGLPYDYEAAERAYFASLTPEQLTKPRWRANKGPDACWVSERMHSAFDALSGVAAANRTPQDLIHEKVFETVEKWFDEPVLNKLRTFRNKHLGHAADANSRKNSPLSKFGFSLNEFAEAQRIVVRIATTIGSRILYDTALGGVVPTPQFDVYAHLDLPTIPAEHREQMNEWWHNHESEREVWLQERIDLMTGEITKIRD